MPLDAGSLSARWLVGGKRSAAQISTTADIIPVFKANGDERQSTPSEMYDAMARHPIPHNTAPPVISGTATVGFTLASTAGNWTNHPTTYTYQWKRDGVNIPSATSSTYLLVSADATHLITCTVTAHNVFGASSATSNSLGPVAAAGGGVPVNTVAPVVSGTTTQGQTLSTTNGTWTNSPTGYTYQWKRNGSSIVGATANTYVLQVADVGATILCVVTASNGSGSASAASNSVGPIAPVTSKLAPNAQWNGTPGSGWGGSAQPAPTPSTRTTAKPVLRPLFVPWMTISGDVVIGFASEAGSATGAANGGVSKVRVLLEGNYLDITSKSSYTATDVNGVTHTFPSGWFCVLDYATWIALSANGTAQMYAQSFAVDGTMQTQTIGPYLFYARTSEFTVTKTLGPGGGYDFTTLQAALSYASTHATDRVRILCKVSGTYPPGNPTSNVAAQWTTVEADAGVTMRLGDGSKVFTQPGFDGIEFRGEGVLFDIADLGYNLASAWRFTNGQTNRLWLNGCEVTCGTPNPAHGGSGSGSAALINGNQPASFWVGGNDPSPSWNLFFTYVNAHDLPAYGLSFYQLRLFCTTTNVSGSDCENGILTYGGSSSQIGGYPSGLLDTTNGAFNLTGPVGSAYECTGGNGGTRTFKVYDVAAGPVTHSYTFTNPTPVATIIAQINTWAGWHATATTTTNQLDGTYLSRADLAPSASIPKTNLVGTAVLIRRADIHADCIVHHTYNWTNGGEFFHTNLASQSTAHISNNGDLPMQDWWTQGTINQDTSYQISVATQPGYWGGARSHVVVRYGSDTNPSGNRFLSGSTSDVYCDVDHWAGAITIASPPLANQKLTSLACPVLPTGADANSKVVSSTQTDLFADPNAVSPNFTPLSPLTLTDSTIAGALNGAGNYQGT